jgi:hypothetical protein
MFCTGKLFYWQPKAQPATTILALNESIQRYAKEKDFVVYRLLFFTSRQSERIALTYSNDWRPSQCCRI